MKHTINLLAALLLMPMITLYAAEKGSPVRQAHAFDIQIGNPCYAVANDIVGKFTGDNGAWAMLVSDNGKDQSPAKISPEILIPGITGEWIHVYRPAGDIFPGPDSERFKTGRYYEEWQVNDHTILKGPDGRWHAFGITHPAIEAGPGVRNVHEAEWFSFHAVSPAGNLKQYLAPGSLKDHPKLLTPADRPGEMKENHSPYIIRHKGEYVMFYGPSPIRYATSKDLFTWNPQGELFRQEGSARDPSVMEHNGIFYMAYTSRQSIMVRTSHDLLTWSEPTVVFSLDPGETGGPESPTLLALNGGYYLIWCRWDAKLTDFVYQDRSFVYYSDDPMNFHNREPVAEIRGHAPELFQDEEGDWWISSAERPYRGVSIAPVKWEVRGSKKQ